MPNYKVSLKFRNPLFDFKYDDDSAQKLKQKCTQITAKIAMKYLSEIILETAIKYVHSVLFFK